MLRWNVLLVALIALAAVVAGQGTKRDFSRWEQEIAALEQRDADQKPANGGVVFTGSSSIRRWDLKQSFPDRELVNHGFGGSTIADATHFADRLVHTLAPKTVVLYAGDNDLANGLSPEQVAADFEAFVAAVHSKLPEARIVFIAIKPSPSRIALLEKQGEANRRIQDAIAKDARRLTYVDVFAPMLDDNGQPRAELFQKDRLHLNEQGYELWSKLLLPHLPKQQ